MKKIASLGIAAFAAVVGVLAFFGAQSPAQAYPDVRIDLTVNRMVLYSGQTFTATGSSNVECAWTLEWGGLVRHGSGTGYETVYTADKVSKVTEIPLHGTCAYHSPTTGAESTWQRTITITVRPQTTAVLAPVGSNLPSSGGPNRLFLAGGLALLVAGATAVTVARRRAEEAEEAAELQAVRATVRAGVRA